MKHFTRALITGSALFALTLAGCQASDQIKISNDANQIKIGNDASKEEIAAIMKDAISFAKSTSGSGSPKLWTYADEDTTVYLFGTVHLLKPDLEWKTSTLTQALREADTLVLEADIKSPESLAAIQKLVAEYGAFSDGKTLSSVLDEEEKAIVTEALTSAGIPMKTIEPLKPWMVGLQLGVLQMMKGGYDPQSGVEQVLLSDPSMANKKLSYLESAETQIQALGGASIDEQIQGLIATISTLELGNDYLDTLVDEWADGDVEGIGAMMSNPALYGSESAHDMLLTNRNESWVAPLKELLNEPGIKLVAVGAGHLAGPDSVIKMLEDEGLKIHIVASQS